MNWLQVGYQYGIGGFFFAAAMYLITAAYMAGYIGIDLYTKSCGKSARHRFGSPRVGPGRGGRRS